MKTLLSSFRRELLEAVLELLWSEWTALGVPGQTRSGSPRVIDPEALILMTCSVGRFDARLFDEMLNWIRMHERMVHVQRLKNMLKEEGLAGGSVLQAVGAWLSTVRSGVKWRRLAEPCAGPATPETLFFSADGDPIPVVRESEPAFERYGFARDAITRRDGVRAFDPESPSNLLIRMRALFGVNSRAEIVAYLLTHERAGAAEIAKATYYYKRTVYNALVEMRLSGLIQSWNFGPENLYGLRGELWKAFSGSEWTNWAPLFRAIELVWQFCEDGLREQSSVPVLATDLHALFDAIAPHVQQAGLIQEVRVTPPRADRRFVEESLIELRRLPEQLLVTS